MSRLNDFIVNISLETSPETVAAFGNILIVTDDVDHAYETYNSLAAVLVDFANSTDTYKIAAAIFAQTPAPTKIAIVGDQTVTPATDLVTLIDAQINQDWFAFVCTNNANTTITALSTWALNNKKYYAATTQDLTLFSTVKDRNTLLQFHSDATMYLAETLMAYMLVREIGSTTAKFKQLKGITESVITDAQLATLHANNGGTYIMDMGVLQTTNSKTQSGEYLDVVLGAAWIEVTMETALRNLALSIGKIPYTNAGIAMLVNIVEDTLKRAAANGIIFLDDSGNASYSLTYTKRQDSTQPDRATRTYNAVNWTAALAGAIEKSTITGTLVA